MNHLISQRNGGLVVKKGLFMSVRGGHNKLTINVDVATALMQKYLGQQGDEAKFLRDNDKRFRNDLKKFRRISFYTTHTAPQKPTREQKRCIIDDFTEQGANNSFFQKKVFKEDGSYTEKKVKTYKIRLQYPNLPCVKMKGNGMVPLELCYVSDADNRYLFKLDDKQTSSMIKITATRPDERRRAIEKNVDACRWGQDPVLQAYGMRIQPTMMKTKARILPAPELMFGAGGQTKSVPGNMTASGQWNLQGKRFAKTSTLKSFGCLIFAKQQHCSLDAATKFMRSLMNSYSQHGGAVENNNPIVQYATPPNVQKSIQDFWTQVGNQVQMRPQILFFIVPYKTSMPYNEIKHYCETELGCVSQCTLVAQAQQCAPQYLSNVCMKLNAKIGGTTCYLSQDNNPLQGRGYNLMIGADVSHAAPGSEKPSFASMVGSTDLHGTRYSGIVGTNGVRQEMISADNMKNFLTTMIYNFKKNTNFLPHRIFYFRDGVSEQQYHHVLDEEVKIMKEICHGINATWAPKFTVTVCSKRHHHRFFQEEPRNRDRNGNVLPGTIIEKDVTDPAEYDFYLNSHKAIQGTARATHYYVIMDETGIPVDDFQALCNNMCYTYIRSTTAVSIIPPVYYAHLASLRGRCHEDIQTRSPATGVSVEVTTIKRLHDSIKDAMWYV
ncbi:Piwi domain-containing protein [Kalaharituber pfeilii]|nr:Piwi domain-containing protein [Kalaharituber pfeilii]